VWPQANGRARPLKSHAWVCPEAHCCKIGGDVVGAAQSAPVAISSDDIMIVLGGPEDNANTDAALISDDGLRSRG
jgi:hypothetical protein